MAENENNHFDPNQLTGDAARLYQAITNGNIEEAVEILETGTVPIEQFFTWQDMGVFNEEQSRDAEFILDEIVLRDEMRLENIAASPSIFEEEIPSSIQSLPENEQHIFRLLSNEIIGDNAVQQIISNYDLAQRVQQWHEQGLISDVAIQLINQKAEELRPQIQQPEWNSAILADPVSEPFPVPSQPERQPVEIPSDIPEALHHDFSLIADQGVITQNVILAAIENPAFAAGIEQLANEGIISEQVFNAYRLSYYLQEPGPLSYFVETGTITPDFIEGIESGEIPLDAIKLVLDNGLAPPQYARELAAAFQDSNPELAGEITAIQENTQTQPSAISPQPNYSSDIQSRTDYPDIQASGNRLEITSQANIGITSQAPDLNIVNSIPRDQFGRRIDNIETLPYAYGEYRQRAQQRETDLNQIDSLNLPAYAEQAANVMSSSRDITPQQILQQNNLFLSPQEMGQAWTIALQLHMGQNSEHSLTPDTALEYVTDGQGKLNSKVLQAIDAFGEEFVNRRLNSYEMTGIPGNYGEDWTPAAEQIIARAFNPAENPGRYAIQIMDTMYNTTPAEWPGVGELSPRGQELAVEIALRTQASEGSSLAINGEQADRLYQQILQAEGAIDSSGRLIEAQASRVFNAIDAAGAQLERAYTTDNVNYERLTGHQATLNTQRISEFEDGRSPGQYAGSQPYSKFLIDERTEYQRQAAYEQNTQRNRAESEQEMQNFTPTPYGVTERSFEFDYVIPEPQIEERHQEELPWQARSEEFFEQLEQAVNVEPERQNRGYSREDYYQALDRLESARSYRNELRNNNFSQIQERIDTVEHDIREVGQLGLNEVQQREHLQELQSQRNILISDLSYLQEQNQNRLTEMNLVVERLESNVLEINPNHVATQRVQRDLNSAIAAREEFEQSFARMTPEQQQILQQLNQRVTELNQSLEYNLRDLPITEQQVQPSQVQADNAPSSLNRHRANQLLESSGQANFAEYVLDLTTRFREGELNHDQLQGIRTELEQIRDSSTSTGRINEAFAVLDGIERSVFPQEAAKRGNIQTPGTINPDNIQARDNGGITSIAQVTYPEGALEAEIQRQRQLQLQGNSTEAQVEENVAQPETGLGTEQNNTNSQETSGGVRVGPEDVLDSGRSVEHPNSGVNPFPVPEPSSENLTPPVNPPERGLEPNDVHDIPDAPPLDTSPETFPNGEREDLTMPHTPPFPAPNERDRIGETQPQAVIEAQQPAAVQSTQPATPRVDINQVAYDLNFYFVSGNVVITPEIEQLRNNGQLISVIQNSNLPQEDKSRLLEIAQDVMQGAPSIIELQQNVHNAQLEVIRTQGEAERARIEAEAARIRADQARIEAQQAQIRAQQEALAAQQEALTAQQNSYQTPPAQPVTTSPYVAPSTALSAGVPSESVNTSISTDDKVRITLERAQQMAREATGEAREQWQNVVNYVQENGPVWVDNAGRFYNEQVVPTATAIGNGINDYILTPATGLAVGFGLGVWEVIKFFNMVFQMGDASPGQENQNPQVALGQQNQNPQIALANIDLGDISQRLRNSGISGGTEVENDNISASVVASQNQQRNASIGMSA